MNIFVEKSVLSEELKIFQGIFEKKTLMEILQNIKITALENGTLELLATDLEIGLSSSITVEVKESGSFTVNGKDFFELISKMPAGIVEISENNDLQILITNEKKTIKYKLLGMQSSDYPKLPIVDFETAIKIPIKKLNSLIYRNYFVVSPEMKFNLGGALMTVSENKIEMASTDGHRLSYTYFLNENFITDSLEFIISRKTLLELLKIGEEGNLEFCYDKNNLFFKYKNRVLSSRIIDQKFPNYKSVIPEKTAFFTTINSEELLQSLRRVLIFKNRNNGVFFNFSNNRLFLERNSPEKGEAYDEISISYNFKPIKIAFNGNFIIDFLTHAESPEIQINMTDHENSFVFKPISADSDLNYIYVVMPLNL